MSKLSLNTLAEVLQINKPNIDADFHGVSIDSRTIRQNNLFFALQGENFDGHNFVVETQKKGAAAAVVQHSVSHSDLPCLIVPNTQKALGQLAAFWRDQFYLPLIGVTGSNGKTTTKNMIAAILKKAVHDHGDHCLATTGNFNNEIGLPLNLMRLNEKNRYSVFEIGMKHFGEIA